MSARKIKRRIYLFRRTDWGFQPIKWITSIRPRAFSSMEIGTIENVRFIYS